jgi:hypothetical protein
LESELIMPQPAIPDGILVQGGPIDGRTLPLSGDPLNPPDKLIYAVSETQQAVYTPRARTEADDGPLWVYVYVRTEPVPTA